MRPVINTFLVLILLLAFSVVNCTGSFAQPLDFEQRVVAAAEKALASTLSVKAVGIRGAQFGAGFVVDREAGLVVTSYHVVARSQKILVRSREQTTDLPCTLLFFEVLVDLALLQCGDSAKLPVPLALAPDSELRPGQFVVTAGSPGGYDFSIAVGVIGATQRVLEDVKGDIPFIQVDAQTFHGSSGGPLCDLNGKVIGINSRSGAKGTVAFALPVSNLVKLLTVYKAKGETPKVQYGYLGATLQPLTNDLRSFLGFKGKGGVVVSHVYSGGPAAKAGIRPADILIRVDQLTLSARSPDEVSIAQNTIAGLGAGRHVLAVWRAGKETAKDVDLVRQSICESEEQEGSKNGLTHHTKDGCYVTPGEDFLEVTPSWLRSRGRGRHVLQEGDLFIALDGSADKLAERVAAVLSGEESTGLATVLRQGRPFLFMLRPKLSSKQ